MQKQKQQKTTNMVKPFVKWAGGKTQLLPQIEPLLPIELQEGEFTYVEPFVGGGAMLFWMLQNYPNIKRVIINDINHNLIVTYRVIKENPEELINNLKELESLYYEKSQRSFQEVDEFYYEKRRSFNCDELADVERAALFIFLNKTCFNGLYRENLSGHFNVPFGKAEKPTICNEDIIRADSELLNKFNVEIYEGNFDETLQYVNPNEKTFFYFDPPYRPLTTTSSFTAYTKQPFNDNTQIELSHYCKELHSRDILWMLSNSDTQDDFFQKLYEGFDIRYVFASRLINSNATKRGKITELIIKNYLTPEFEYEKVKLKLKES